MTVVEPPDYYHFRSPRGSAICDGCGKRWPCHLSAWGNPGHTSTHNACGGDVRWVGPEMLALRDA